MPQPSAFTRGDVSGSVNVGALSTQTSLQQVPRKSVNPPRRPLGEIDGNPQRGPLKPLAKAPPPSTKKSETIQTRSNGGSNSGNRHNGSGPSRGGQYTSEHHPISTRPSAEGHTGVPRQPDSKPLRPQVRPSATPENLGCSKSSPLPSSLPQQLIGGHMPPGGSRHASGAPGPSFTQTSCSTHRSSHHVVPDATQSTPQHKPIKSSNKEQGDYLRNVRDARVTKERQQRRVQQLAGNKFVQAVQKQERQERLTRRTGLEQSPKLSRSPDGLEETIQMLHNTALGGGTHARPSTALRPQHGGRPPGSSTSHLQHGNFSGAKTGAANDQPARNVESKASALLARLFS